MGGPHLFPALQQLSSRTFLHLVPVTDPSGVCNLYFGSVRTAISSFPLVSWRVQTLRDLWKMVIHVRANCQGNQGLHNILYNDAGFRRPTGTLILPAVNLKCSDTKRELPPHYSFSICSIFSLFCTVVQ